jgi:hypothetical protein
MGRIMQSADDKVYEAVLAMLSLTSFADHGLTRAWKSLDSDALERLHERGLISEPRSKARSVVFSEEGRRLAEESFRAPFTAAP